MDADENNKFQRIGAVSNTHVGSDFEAVARAHLLATGLAVEPRFSVLIGVGANKKNRLFDLGSSSPKIIVECKSHRWTIGGNMPSAKMTVWNEAMFYFSLAPHDYRKILFVLRDFNVRKQETLAHYYLRIHGHLIPEGVEIWEYDDSTKHVSILKSGEDAR